MVTTVTQCQPSMKKTSLLFTFMKNVTDSVTNLLQTDTVPDVQEKWLWLQTTIYAVLVLHLMLK